MNTSDKPLTEAEFAQFLYMSPEFLAKHRKAQPEVAAALSYVGRSPRYERDWIKEFCLKHRGVPSEGEGSPLKPAHCDVSPSLDLNQPLLTTKQAANVLSVQPSWFEKNRSCFPESVPPGYRFGRCWRYSEPELREWMKAGGRSRVTTGV